MRRTYALAALLLLLIEAVIAWRLDDDLIRPHLGDSLAVALVCCAIRAVAALSVASATLTSLAIAFAVELSQACRLIDLLGLGHNSLARVALGAVFDPRDLIAYLAGGAMILLAERSCVTIGGKRRRP